MSRSLTRAWAPVPLKGQSSRIAPRFASTLRATSFTGIGSVLVSITIVPRLADAPSSAATSARAYAEGSEVMTISVRRATSRGLLAAMPPDRTCSARRRGTTSKPATRNPARMRFADIAEPMIPRPIIPTVCCFIAFLFFCWSAGKYATILAQKKGVGVAGPVSNLLGGVDIGGTFTDCVVLRRNRGAHPRHHGRHERADPEKGREGWPDHDAGPRGRDSHHARLARRFLARHRQGGPLSLQPETRADRAQALDRGRLGARRLLR